jgi:hypothetical protein
MIFLLLQYIYIYIDETSDTRGITLRNTLIYITISIYDYTGKKLQKKNLSKKKQLQKELNIEPQNQGE